MGIQQFYSGAMRLSPRNILTGAPAGDSLENVYTGQQADGALCWVRSAQADFRLLLSSALAPDGVNIIAPVNGPGRWIRVTPTAGKLVSVSGQQLTTDQVVLPGGAFTPVPLAPIVLPVVSGQIVRAAAYIVCSNSGGGGETLFTIQADGVDLLLPFGEIARGGLALEFFNPFVPANPFTVFQLAWRSIVGNGQIRPVTVPGEACSFSVALWDAP